MEILSRNVSFHQKIGTIQNNAALAIAGAIRGTSWEKLYHELGFESLVSRIWYRKLCCFYEVFKTQPRYLLEVIPTAKRVYVTGNNDKLPHVKVKHNYFENSFLWLWLNEIKWIWTFVIPNVVISTFAILNFEIYTSFRKSYLSLQ